MAITRANAEAILIKRLGALLTEAGLDGTTVTGTNADLNDPIGYALRKLGQTVTAPTAVADADLSGLGSDDYDEFFDLAELRSLETVHNTLTSVNISVGPRREELSQLADRVAKRIADKRAAMAEEYGRGLKPLEAGYITLDFMEKGDDD